jgi:hypothetical protein
MTLAVELPTGVSKKHAGGAVHPRLTLFSPFFLLLFSEVRPGNTLKAPAPIFLHKHFLQKFLYI